MLTAVFWDVQHGSAAYVRTPGGQHIAIDLGTGSCLGESLDFSPLFHLKQKYGVFPLDAVVITHPHRDHLDDIFQFDELSPRILITPRHLQEGAIRAGNGRGDSEIIDKYMEIMDRYSSPLSGWFDPLSPSHNGGVSIQTFAPSGCAESNLNNHSVVTVLTYVGLKIIIPGDNEPPSWTELLDNPSFVSAIKGADILVAPHHGRKSAFSQDLFQYITPKLTIISDGPLGETSATDLYSNQSSGWPVHKRSGGCGERKCVTTRKDGVIVVKFGKLLFANPFIEVGID